MYQFPMVTLLVVALASSASGGSHPKDAATDDARLQGTWEVVKAESLGEVDKASIGIRQTFASGRIRITKTPLDVYLQITYTANPAKRPRQIDLAIKDLADKEGSGEVEFAGIYRLDGDRLTLCFTSPKLPGDDAFDHRLEPWLVRPKKFSSRVHGLLVLQRVKTPKANLDQH